MLRRFLNAFRTPRIFVLHAIKHQSAVERRLVTYCHIGDLIGDFQQTLANRSTLSFGSSLMISDALTVKL
ncbi:MAG: hypothetical protein DME90_12110 [Verrucomicrobia bacterium]|nr:MAG: hypothetical protein DME90_12110 [Verrucomicrobiota bacterium]